MNKLRSARWARSPSAPFLATFAAGVLAAGCTGESADQQSLSQDAQAGIVLFGESGCAACHGAEGRGGVGPSLVGLIDTTVELADGTTIVVDEQYLTRSIADPSAELVAGFTIVMPPNQLDDAEVSSVVSYLKELE